MSRLSEWLKEDIGGRDEPTSDAVLQDDSIYAEYDEPGSDVSRNIDTEYHKFTLRKVIFLVVCIAAIIVASGLIITYGDYPLSFGQVYGIIWDHLLNGAPTYPPDTALEVMDDHVVWSLRLPRVLVGIISGFGLAVAGAVMQSTLKNPMADSYTTGVSSGAAFGATMSMAFGINLVSGDLGMLINAFVFSLVPTAMIIVIARARKISSTSMILAGLAVMYIFNALTAALKLMADPDALAALYRWQVGSLNNMMWDDVPVMLAVTILGSILLMLLSNKINILSSGDDNAKTLGVDASKLRVVCLVIVSLITASIVCYTGTIGFIGLVAPHIVRLFIGADNRFLIPASGVFGGLMMIVADIIGRTVLAPSVLEVGVVTAFIGGPLFLWLIIRQKREVWT